MLTTGNNFLDYFTIFPEIIHHVSCSHNKLEKNIWKEDALPHPMANGALCLSTMVKPALHKTETLMML
jgi:hypothetical protein